MAQHLVKRTGDFLQQGLLSQYIPSNSDCMPGLLGCLTPLPNKCEAQPGYGRIKDDFGAYAHVHHRVEDALGPCASSQQDATGATYKNTGSVRDHRTDNE